jgi:predicted MFS family arabinose efflux permease
MHDRPRGAANDRCSLGRALPGDTDVNRKHGAERHPLLDALLLSGSVTIALGFARFSYTLLLPSMRADLHLSFARAGALGTANTLGYLVGVITLPRVLTRIQPRQALLIGSFGIAFTLLATSLSSAYPWLASARFAAGYLGASANIVGLSLAAGLVSRHPAALILFNAGAGIGIVAAGVTLPPLLAGNDHRWKLAWLVLGAMGLLAAFCCSLANAQPRPASIATTPPTLVTPPTVVSSTADHPPLTWLTASYVCFGCGYIVYLTFLVARLRSQNTPTALVAVAFALLGACCVISPLLWTRLQKRATQPQLLCVSMIAQTVAALLLLIPRTPVALASVALFGVSFMASPTFVTGTIRQMRPQRQWTSAISRVTVPFAIGQAIAPWLSGAGIDRLGSAFAPSWTALFCAAGAYCALQQPLGSTVTKSAVGHDAKSRLS